MKKQKGFTLIEMLIVVAIIGLLATIVLLAVTRARKKSMATQMKAHMEEMMKGMEMAGADGCPTVSAYGFTGTSSLTCTPPGASGAVTYVSRIPAPPQGCAGCTYTATSGTNTASYSFQAAGFENSQTFTCTGGACFCSVDGGCQSIP
ncbi:type II secretion system GspH family protein [Patescibacteria group bacterium]|nr:type II secretion system GspH family protein [Patescibacteria group bacterium]